jgi:hypothetical protein
MRVVHIARQKLGTGVEKNHAHKKKRTSNVERPTSNVEVRRSLP